MKNDAERDFKELLIQQEQERETTKKHVLFALLLIIFSGVLFFLLATLYPQVTKQVVPPKACKCVCTCPPCSPKGVIK